MRRCRRPRAYREISHQGHGPAAQASRRPELDLWSVCPVPRVPDAGLQRRSTTDSPCGRQWRARRPTRAASPVGGCRRVRGRGSIRHHRAPIGIRDIGDCRPARAGRIRVPANGSGRPMPREDRGTRTAVNNRRSGCDARRHTTGVRLRASPPGSTARFRHGLRRRLAGHRQHRVECTQRRPWFGSVTVAQPGRWGCSEGTTRHRACAQGVTLRGGVYDSRASFSAAPTYAAGVRASRASFSSRGIARDSMKRTRVSRSIVRPRVSSFSRS